MTLPLFAKPVDFDPETQKQLNTAVSAVFLAQTNPTVKSALDQLLFVMELAYSESNETYNVDYYIGVQSQTNR